MHTISIRNGMGTATISGSSVVMTGAKESDFYHFASDFLYGPGVQNILAGDCAVTQNSPAGMSVLVAAGTIYVPQTSYTKNGSLTKLWRDEIDAQEALVIAANSSGSVRIDIICEKVDTAATPNSEATNVGSYVVVQGTPGAGVPATPSNHIKLAEVTVANGASSITNANITDKRIKAHMLDINGPDGFLMNGKLVVSVATNNLTASVKTLSGDDPSAINPVGVRINGVFYLITAALTLTRNASTNWGNGGGAELAAQEIDWFAYLLVSGGVVYLAFSRICHGRVYSDFSGTTTNEKYLATSASPSSTDPVVNIGRFNATLSASPFNWSIPATPIVIDRPCFTTRPLTFNIVTPTVGAMTVTGGVADTAKYIIRENSIVIEVSVTGMTTGGTPASTIRVNLPMSAAFRNILSCFVKDATYSVGLAQIIVGVPTAVEFSKGDLSNYGTGAAREVYGGGVYFVS